MRGGDADMVMVGDRGMISQKAIDEMRDTEGIGWITALKSASVRTPIEQGQLQLGLFDEHNLHQYKVAKHFELAIGETTFSFGRKPDSIAAEAALDGLYIIRTSVPAQQMRTYELPLSIALVPAGFAIANIVIGIRIALHLMSGTASQPPCADYQS